MIEVRDARRAEGESLRTEPSQSVGVVGVVGDGVRRRARCGGEVLFVRGEDLAVKKRSRSGREQDPLAL